MSGGNAAMDCVEQINFISFPSKTFVTNHVLCYNMQRGLVKKNIIDMVVYAGSAPRVGNATTKRAWLQQSFVDGDPRGTNTSSNDNRRQIHEAVEPMPALFELAKVSGSYPRSKRMCRAHSALSPTKTNQLAITMASSAGPSSTNTNAAAAAAAASEGSSGTTAVSEEVRPSPSESPPKQNP